MLYIDTREKPPAAKRAITYCNTCGARYHVHALPFGDYMLSQGNGTAWPTCIERKASLQELAGNCGRHNQRFNSELRKAYEYGYRVVLICETAPQYSSLESIRGWRSSQEGAKITGEHIYKCLTTWSKRNLIAEIIFCTPETFMPTAIAALKKQEVKPCPE